MTKQEIVNIVSQSSGLTKIETETIMNGVMETIISSLEKNERVELRGFGTFGIKHRMPKKKLVTLVLVNQFIFPKDMCLPLNQVS